MRSASEEQRLLDDRIVSKAENNFAAVGSIRAALDTQFAGAVADQRAAQEVQYDDDGVEVEIWLMGDPVGSNPI